MKPEEDSNEASSMLPQGRGMKRSMRTMLFVPGNNLHMIQRAWDFEADALIFDLEDSVPLSEKQTARDHVKKAVKSRTEQKMAVYVRVNAASSGLIEKDIEQVLQPGLDGLLLPEAEGRSDLLYLQSIIHSLGMVPERFSLIPLLESPAGILNVMDIASAAGVIALAFGALDYTRSMGIQLSQQGTETLFPRSQIAITAHAAGILAFDSPWFEIHDMKGLERDSLLARSLGYHGKLVIHPKHLPVVNRVFSPTEKEMDKAASIVEAFERGLAAGKGAVLLEGRMIDRASYRAALDLLEKVEARNCRKDFPA